MRQNRRLRGAARLLQIVGAKGRALNGEKCPDDCKDGLQIGRQEIGLTRALAGNPSARRKGDEHRPIVQLSNLRLR
jgi:hypothetical protein